MTDDPKPPQSEEQKAVWTRRQMLVRLGLVAGAIYAAPALANLTEARASSGGSFSRASRGSGSGRRRRRKQNRSRPSFSAASRGSGRRRGVQAIRPRKLFGLGSR